LEDNNMLSTLAAKKTNLIIGLILLAIAVGARVLTGKQRASA
jgi:hypothetical protein